MATLAPARFRLKARAATVMGAIAGVAAMGFGQSATLSDASGGVSTGGMQWDAVSGATAIRIYVGTAPDSLSLNTSLAGVATGIDWIDLDTPMDEDVTYYVQVRAYDGTNESTHYGTTVWLNGSQVG